MRPADRAAEFLRHYLTAVQFFTRLPVTGALAEWVGFSPAMLRASTAHLPGVGWLVGLAACAAFFALSVLLPVTGATPLAAAVGSTLVTVWLTGAFHEDGLADLADGLGGHVDRARALEIMKDSRLGSYGALALVLVIGLKVALLAVLAAVSPTAVLAALLAAHVGSRFWPLLVIRTLPYIGEDGQSKSRPLADGISGTSLAVAAAWCVVPLAIAAFVQGVGFVVAGLVGSAIIWFGMRRLLQRRLQGFTGDALGATQQACEVAFYLGAAVWVGGSVA